MYYDCSSLLKMFAWESGASELMQVLPKPVQKQTAEDGFGLCALQCLTDLSWEPQT